MPSKLLFHEKRLEDDGGITEMKIWEVPVSGNYPDGVRYSLYRVNEGGIIVGYDNHYPKGHHRHYGAKQEPYAFTTIEKLIADFLNDLRKETP